MATRVAVFIDYQNVYSLARRAFFLPHDPHHCGQVFPSALGHELAEGVEPDRELVGVFAYRGMPESRRDPQASSACSRQISAWAKAGVKTTWRPLRYPQAYPLEKPQEKGIDVQLAIDYVMKAINGDYDVGVLFSGDSDQKPALLAVQALRGPVAIEVAAWSSPSGYATRVSIGGTGTHRTPYCHMLDRTAYDRVRDTTDYNVKP
jgi:NYN domain